MSVPARSTPEPAGTVEAPIGGWANPRGGFLFFLGFAAIGSGMAFVVPAVLTISIKASAIDPANQTNILSAAIAVGAIAALIAYPTLGRISDRITWRSGRRRPLLILGAILIAAGAPVILAAQSTGGLAVGSILTQVGFAGTTVALTSTIPDKFEPLRRGPASALVGLGLPLGALVGLFLAQLVSPHLAAMILLPAGVAVVAILLFAIILKDPPFPAEARVPFEFRTFFATFWVNPVRNPAFAWAWWSRLFIYFGVAAVQAYQVFYFEKALKIPTKDIAQDVFLATLVLVVLALATGAISAKISDRIGRRKPFVITSAIVFSIGLLVVALAHSFPAFLIGIAIVGLGQGVYFAVDLALVSQVLPDAQNPAKAMGVMGLASTLPSSLVPAVAPGVLLIGASAADPQNFPALFITGAIVGIIGAVFVLPIRRVR